MMQENKKEKNIKNEEEQDIKNEIKHDEREKNQNTNNVNDINKNAKDDETKFKKVETNNNKEKDKGKKKHIFLKTILIIIGILVIAYFIFAIRNYLILKDILVKAGRFEGIEEYSYEINSEQGDIEIKRKYTIKNGVERIDLDNITKQERDVVYWKDTSTGEEIISFPGYQKAIKNVDQTLVGGTNFPFKFSELNEEMSGLGLFALIYTENLDGKNCYVIQITRDYKIWVEKETGIVVKEENNENVEELTSLNITNVPNIYKPDLTGYEVNVQE